MKFELLIGTGKHGSLYETTNKASISQPRGIAVEFDNVVYLTDSENNAIRTC